MNDCEQLPGRLRDLCEGKGRDGRADPPPLVVEAFRHNLPELLKKLNSDLQLLHSISLQGSVVDRIPKTGPGKKLEDIFEQLSIPYQEACGCAAFARQMDSWGITGCREHFDDIVERLRTNAAKYSLWEQLKAAGRALQTGLAFQVNLLDPFPALVQEAIRQAEAEAELINDAR